PWKIAFQAAKSSVETGSDTVHPAFEELRDASSAASSQKSSPASRSFLRWLGRGNLFVTCKRLLSCSKWIIFYSISTSISSDPPRMQSTQINRSLLKQTSGRLPRCSESPEARSALFLHFMDLVQKIVDDNRQLFRGFVHAHMPGPF